MPIDLRDPAVLLQRIDGADRELRLWYLLLVTWQAMGLAFDDESLSRFMAHGARLEGLREKVSQVGKRKRASDQFFQEVLDVMEAHRKVEGRIWELATRFSEERGVRLEGWGLPPEWR
ncbi:MAG TPA: hypothetical protein VJ547_11275 [Candidatus Thermoplasmatota archaeon]|nr:hypothetical protein [Candidatus Thermoplasmatota archaeon]